MVSPLSHLLDSLCPYNCTPSFSRKQDPPKKIFLNAITKQYETKNIYRNTTGFVLLAMESTFMCG